MSQFVIELESTNAVTYTEGYRKTEEGRLRSVIVTYPGAFGATGKSLYVVAGCMQGGRGVEFITVIFFSKYFSWRDMTGWTGDYPFDPYEEIFCWALSDGNRSIRLVGKIDLGG